MGMLRPDLTTQETISQIPNPNQEGFCTNPNQEGLAFADRDFIDGFKDGGANAKPLRVNGMQVYRSVRHTTPYRYWTKLHDATRSIKTIPCRG
jgi:hypothetical protein